MDVLQTPGKRKRETNIPRITYHVANRTFDRLFKEETLNETKDVVRRKLGLPESTNVHLAQLRGETIVDLEDEDDFDAFYAVAHSKMAVDVRVTTEPTSSSDDNNSNAASASPEINPSAMRKRKVTFLDAQNVPPNKRRVSLTSSSPTVDASTSEGSHSSPIIIYPVAPIHDPAHASENQQDPTSSEPPPTKPPKGKKKKARATDTESIEVEESSTLPPADDTTDASENRPDPGPSKKPTKGKKKAKKADAEPGEAEADPSTVSLDDNDVNGTTNVPENPEPSEPPSKKPPKTKKKARATDAEPAETEAGPSTEPLEDGLNEGEPIPKKKRKRRENIADEAAGAPTTKKVKKAKVQNDVADANGGFHQQLADTINGSATGLNEAAASGKDAPPPKRTKPENSTGGPNPKTKPQEQKTNGKVAEPILNGTSEKAEQSEGKAKRKKNKESKKEGESELSAEKRAAVEQSIELAMERATCTQPLRKGASSTEILEAAKSGAERAVSKPNKIVANPPSASKTASVPIASVAPISSESSDDDDDGDRQLVTNPLKPVPQSLPTPNDPDPYAHIDLDQLIRGPRKRRLTLDIILPLATTSSPRRNAVVLEEDPIVKPKSAHRSLARASAWSDSDEAGEESASDKAESESKDIPNPPNESSSGISNPSDSGPSNSNAESVPVPSSDVATSPGQISSAVHEGIAGGSAEISDSSTAVNEQAADVHGSARGSERERRPSASQTIPVEEHDPIEPVIPSPRARSPIETTLPATSQPNGRSTAKTPLKVEAVLPRRSTRKANSQPISQHEADIRESVVRLTKSRSKQAPIASSPGAPPSPRRLRSSSHPDRAASTNAAQTAGENGSSEVLDSLWTTLNAGPSSTVDADSTHGVDELHSSPEWGRDPLVVASELDSGIPLFIASESQVDFPYSQFQDLDVDTDNIGVDTMPTVARLEEDSEEEDEVENTITARSPRRGSTAYRGLSQIASQNKFFTGFKPHSVSTPKNSKEDMYGPLSQAYDDVGSDSGSESETEKSHIPKARRAGNKR